MSETGTVADIAALPPLHLDLAAAGRVVNCKGAGLRAYAEAGGLDPARDFRGLDLRDWDLAGQDLSGFDLSGCDLRDTGIEFAIIGDARLEHVAVDDGVVPGANASPMLTREDLDILAQRAGTLYGDDDDASRSALVAAGVVLLPLLESQFGPRNRNVLRIALYVGAAEVQTGESVIGHLRLIEMTTHWLADGGLERDGEVLLGRFYIALALHDLGRAAEALAEYDSLLPLDEAVRGPRDPSTLTTRHCRARALLGLGRAAEALAEYDRLLPLDEAVCGPRDASTLTTRHYRARALLDLGRAAEALAEYDSLLPLDEAVHGPRDSSTLTTRLYRAHALLDLGRAAEALPEIADISAGYAASKGKDHWWVAAARSDEIRARIALGERGFADELRRLSDQIARDLYPHSPVGLQTRYLLALSLAQAGDEAGARSEIATILDLYKRASIESHPYLSKTLRLRDRIGVASDPVGFSA